MSESTSTVRVLLVEDHGAVADGFAAVLPSYGPIVCVGQAAEVDEALERAIALRPDVALVDVHLRGGSGLDLAPRLLDAVPGLRVLFLSAYVNPEYVAAALACGARGYLSKDESGEAVAAAILTVAGGGQALCPTATAIAEAITTRGKGGTLSGQERRVLTGIARDRSLSEIARRLGIEVGTVRGYWRTTCEKLGLSLMPRRLVRLAGARQSADDSVEDAEVAEVGRGGEPGPGAEPGGETPDDA
jgi:DNA-binding NarL/FixJ family response regulator